MEAGGFQGVELLLNGVFSFIYFGHTSKISSSIHKLDVQRGATGTFSHVWGATHTICKLSQAYESFLVFVIASEYSRGMWVVKFIT